MQYASIPRTSLTPSVLCLGTADMGAKIPRDTSFSLLDAFIDAGGTFIDTAEIYSDWQPGEKSRSEKLIGEWLRARGNRDTLVLATKGAHPRSDSMHVGRMSRAEIEHDLNASLVNLRTDVIDLYWLHRDDPATPVEDVIETLNAQVRAGKIKHFGCSNWRTARISAANAYAKNAGVQGFVANQPLWNLAFVPQESLGDQTCAVMDEAMLAMHRTTGMACVPFSSQANGYFQRAVDGTVSQMNPVHQRMYAQPETARRFERAQQVARETGLTMTQVVLGYLLAQPFPTFPIIGCRPLDQLHDSLTVTAVRPDLEQLRNLAVA
jgi:aryl-alcohol dehydrogenase-like predicted oxidoreductase